MVDARGNVLIVHLPFAGSRFGRTKQSLTANCPERRFDLGGMREAIGFNCYDVMALLVWIAG